MLTDSIRLINTRVIIRILAASELDGRRAKKWQLWRKRPMPPWRNTAEYSRREHLVLASTGNSWQRCQRLARKRNNRGRSPPTSARAFTKRELCYRISNITRKRIISALRVIINREKNWSGIFRARGFMDEQLRMTPTNLSCYYLFVVSKH